MSISSRTCLSAMAAVVVMTFMTASSANANALNCKYGKYEVEYRDENQLKILFGTSYCTIRRFSYRSDAENFARNNGMQPGRPCSCR